MIPKGVVCLLLLFASLCWRRPCCCMAAALSMLQQKHDTTTASRFHPACGRVGDNDMRSRAAAALQGISVSGDDEYPWSFTGRLWFRPALVRTPQISDFTATASAATAVQVISIFGWTIGGVVALENEKSPIGPYREYVSMGALVLKRGAVGSWGKRLYVSCPEAEKLCRDIWGIPAEYADIEFVEEGPSMRVTAAPGINDNASLLPKIQVDGWCNTRIVDPEHAPDKRLGPLPVFWTPAIKALWTPFVPLPSQLLSDAKQLPLHRLRLSASSVGLCSCGQGRSESLGIPFGFGLVVDNILIEISPQIGEL